MIKTIKINWLNINSIIKSEILKAKLENKGFNYKGIKKIDFNNDILIYNKE